MSTRLAAPLRRPAFRRAYAAQAINLVGDGLTWVGLALAAHELAGPGAGGVLALALVTRVTMYVAVAPWAGVLADRVPRRRLLVGSLLGRMALMLVLTAVGSTWQLVGVVALLNALAAVYTPTFNASLPALVADDEYGDALTLTSATFEVLGVLGPAVAAGIVAVGSLDAIFVADAATFLVAALLLAGVGLGRPDPTPRRPLADVAVGTRALFGNRVTRGTLLFELAAALAGAAVLVGSVGLVRDGLERSGTAYGIVMASAGVGAAVAALSSGLLVGRLGPVRVAALGAVLATASIVPATAVPALAVGALWALHGAGLSLTGVASARAIVAEIPAERHGRTFGAHFAWSHAWWLIAYPCAGLLAEVGPSAPFLPLGLAGLALALALAGLAVRR